MARRDHRCRSYEKVQPSLFGCEGKSPSRQASKIITPITPVSPLVVERVTASSRRSAPSRCNDPAPRSSVLVGGSVVWSSKDRTGSVFVSTEPGGIARPVCHPYSSWIQEGKPNVVSPSPIHKPPSLEVLDNRPTTSSSVLNTAIPPIGSRSAFSVIHQRDSVQDCDSMPDASQSPLIYSPEGYDDPVHRLPPPVASQAFTQGRSTTSADVAPPTHLCPSCRMLMTPPDRTPMLLVPCGHALCAKCSQTPSTRCSLCPNDVTSLMENHALGTLVLDYKRRKDAEELARRESLAMKYAEEYHCLATRVSALKEERSSIEAALSSIDQATLAQKDILAKRRDRSEAIRQEIDSLQRELEHCKQASETAAQVLRDLDSKRNRQVGRLDVLDETIRTVEQSRERIREMLGSIAPSIDPDSL